MLTEVVLSPGALDRYLGPHARSMGQHNSTGNGSVALAIEEEIAN